jgi:hypothetical protein
VEVADQLPAQLHHAAVRDLGLLDPAAGAIAGLEHEHVATGPVEVARSREAGQAGAHHDDVGHRASGPWMRCSSSCTRSRSASTTGSSPGTVSASR